MCKQNEKEDRDRTYLGSKDGKAQVHVEASSEAWCEYRSARMMNYDNQHHTGLTTTHTATSVANVKQEPSCR